MFLNHNDTIPYGVKGRSGDVRTVWITPTLPWNFINGDYVISSRCKVPGELMGRVMFLKSAKEMYFPTCFPNNRMTDHPVHQKVVEPQAPLAQIASLNSTPFARLRTVQDYSAAY